MSRFERTFETTLEGVDGERATKMKMCSASAMTPCEQVICKVSRHRGGSVCSARVQGWVFSSAPASLEVVADLVGIVGGRRRSLSAPRQGAVHRENPVKLVSGFAP